MFDRSTPIFVSAKEIEYLLLKISYQSHTEKSLSGGVLPGSQSMSDKPDDGVGVTFVHHSIRDGDVLLLWPTKDLYTVYIWIIGDRCS